MKITLPTVHINEDEGFSTEKDIFKRKDFGLRLKALFENSQEELVVALNAPWGEGKSTFIKMWQNHIRINQDELKIKTMYFDAFKNDYQKDPFLAITSEIYSLCDTEKESKKDFLESAKNVGKSLARGSFKIGTKLLTSGIVDDSFLEGNSNDISSLLNNNIDNLIENRIKNHKADKNSFDKFKTDLENFISDEKPLVFIIDELDRCRPDFALELLEQIKHLFSVKNLHFLLIVNAKQLEAAIKSKYGNNINASQYLQKFINLTLELPKKTTEYEDYNKTFISWSLCEMLEENEIIQNKDLIETVEEIATFYNPSFREIERVLSNIAILHNMSPDTKYNMYYQISMAFLCYIKVTNTEAFDLIKYEKTSPDEIFIKLGLDKLVYKEEDYQYYHLKLIKDLLVFDYADDEQKKDLMNKNSNLRSSLERGYGFNRGGLFKKIIENLSTLNNR